jgi:hypothetical protein
VKIRNKRVIDDDALDSKVLNSNDKDDDEEDETF